MDNSPRSTSFAWGLPIKDYIVVFSNHTPSKKKPTRYEIKQAIELVKSGYPSCEHFEFLLSLADRPGYFRTFLDDGLVPGCMRLLREYCQTNSLFDYAYGVLCLRTLALVLQVGMLETINPNILNQYDTIPVPHYGKTGPIGAFMRQLLVASNGLLHHNRELLQDFRWYKQDDRLACLSVVGGFTSADVNFLLKSIDQSAVPCQTVMRSMRINGFATILFLMWQHVLFLEGKVDVCLLVLNLIFRYFPFSLRAEYDILRFMNTWLGQRIADLGRYLRFIPASLYDLRTAIESLEDKLRKPYEEEEPLEIEDVAMLTGSLSEGLPTDAVDSVAPLLRTIFMRCWVEIEGLRKEPENRGNIMHLCGRGLLVVTPKLLREDFVSELLRSLPGLDFLSLLGRVMLLGLRPFERKGTQEDEEALATFIQGVDVFFSTLAYSFHPLLHATFQGSYRD